jgi:hypothetical protein
MLPAEVIGLIGVIFGGVGREAIVRWFSRGEQKADEATTIRAELRTEIAALREERQQLREEADRWRAKYYELLYMVAMSRSFEDLRANVVVLQAQEDNDG